MKKHLKWILPTAAVAVLLAVAAVLIGLFGSQKPQTEQPAEDEIKVYWNVDRNDYWDADNKVSMRMKAGDNYRVRFAVGGEQIDLFVDNYEIMNQIDSQKFMGLRVNEENVVTQVLKPHEFTGGLAVYEYFVVDIQDGLVICNNLASGKGLPLKLKINENTQIYDVGGEGLLVGLPGQLEIGCQVYGVMGLDGYVSHLYVMPPFEPEPVYWNVERMYNSSAKVSTRQRDEAGYFTYEFIVDGEAVTLRTREADVANQVDSFGAKCMHLEFDEEGLISEATHAKNSTGGSSIASWYHVLRIDSLENPDSIEVVANGFYAEKFSGSDKGNTAECTLADNVKIYDMSGKGAYLGEETELRLYDQVHCLTNPYGDVCIIFIINRPIEAELYYNLEQKWNSDTKTSTRTKASDGYYYFEMAVKGQHVTLKTQDPEIVKTIDGRAAKVLGLELEGDVITGAYVPSAIAGSQATVYDYCTVTEIAADGTVTAERNGNIYTGVVTADTKVYNVASTAGKKGEETTIKLGDKLYGFRDLTGKVTTVYVVSRQVNGPVYWNLDRSYDSTNKVTKRKPAEDGYYYFDLAVGTKTVTYKTKSKEIANTLDSYVAVALQLSGDVITKVYKYDQVKGYTGGGFASWCDVQSVSGSIVTAANSSKTHTGTMASGCVIYDVSRGSAAPVAKTKLQVGDRIHGIKNADGQIAVIYVVKRIIKADLYYNISRKWDSDKGITTRVPDADGWYWFDMSVNGQQVRLKTDNIDLVNTIDGRGAKVLGLKVDGDVITAAYKPSEVSGSEKTVFDYADVTAIAADGTITATRNGKTFTGRPASNCKVFNVTNSAAQIGELSKVKVGDKLYGLGNSKGQLTNVYIVGRQLQAELYYNITRMWDSANSVSTRTADADGWYWFDMILDTKPVKLKTKDTGVVNVIDGRAAKVLGLEVEGDVITAAYKPSEVTGSEKTIFDFTDVKQIAADGTITATKSGKTVTGKLAEGCKVYNVSSAAGQLGEVTTVEVGDQIYGLGSDSKLANYVFIIKRTAKAETKTALCTVCDQTVEWNSWDGASSLKEGGHWYLAGNVSVKATASISGSTQVCMDLCGYEVNGAETLDRIFNIYGTFNLMDSTGTGKVIANYSNEAGRTGSVFYIQNSKTSGYGVFNMYGGTLTATGITKQGGIGGVANEFNMYGGCLTGGKAIKGGNLFIEASSTAKVTIYGGTINGGAADLGGDIYTRQRLTVSGAPQIGEIYLETGKTITVDGLTDGAAISVTLADTYGVFATGAVEADVDRFTVAEGLTVEFANGELSIPNPSIPVVPHDDHCICGGLGAVGDHTCTETVPTWEPWTGKEKEGYYYLTTDMELTSTLTVAENKTLNLCLNGFTITNKTTDRIFNLNGALNLCDHKNEDGIYAGQVISEYEGTSTRTGRIFYVQNKTNAAFNMFGGNLISNSATQKGSVGGTAKTFNMYDGSISGGKALVTGGNLQIDAGTTTVYGGSITGGKSVDGGNIYVNVGTLQILGGQITGGEAENSGGDIYVGTRPSMTVSGAPEIGNVYLSTGKTIAVDGLGDGAAIGVSLEGTYGNFATGAVEADITRFTVAEGLSVEYANGTLNIMASQGSEDPEVPVHTDHCICSGLGQVGDHICDPENVPVWEPWTGTWESGKYYYLTADYDLTATIKLEEGQTLNLCLNGHDIRGGTAVTRVFNIFGILNLCDHADEEGNYAGEVISNYDTAGGNTQTGRVFYVQNKTNAAFNMYGGNLKSNSSTKNGGVGGVCAVYNLYAGTVSGGISTEKGGNLILEAGNANVTLYGGTITGGTSVDGGNIYIKSSGKVTVSGGTISGGLASGVKNANNGGNIYVEKGTLTLTDGLISGGYTSNAGGSIRVNADGVLNINGGLLTGGYAKGNGGNVYSQGTIVITGGTISDGKVASSKIGGNLYASSGSLTISDDPAIDGKPEISGGSATTGGNIAVKADGCTISGCTVTGGTADYGPDIYFEKSGGTLTVSGCGPVEVYAKTGSVDGDSDVTVTTP